MEGAGSLQQMRDLVREFHAAHLDFGDASTMACSLIRQEFLYCLRCLRARPGVCMKMRGKGLEIDEVHDLFAFRVIVPTEADWYAALGVIHGLYEAEVSRFKDYIAEPKDNGYQALHTCVQSEGAPLIIRRCHPHRRSLREVQGGAHRIATLIPMCLWAKLSGNGCALPTR